MQAVVSTFSALKSGCLGTVHLTETLSRKAEAGGFDYNPSPTWLCFSFVNSVVATPMVASEGRRLVSTPDVPVKQRLMMSGPWDGPFTRFNRPDVFLNRLRQSPFADVPRGREYDPLQYTNGYPRRDGYLDTPSASSLIEGLLGIRPPAPRTEYGWDAMVDEVNEALTRSPTCTPADIPVQHKGTTTDSSTSIPVQYKDTIPDRPVQYRSTAPDSRTSIPVQYADLPAEGTYRVTPLPYTQYDYNGGAYACTAVAMSCAVRFLAIRNQDPGRIARVLRDECGRVIGQGVTWYKEWQAVDPDTNTGLVSAVELQERTDVGAYLYVEEEHARGGLIAGEDLERCVAGMEEGSAHTFVTTAGLSVCVMVAGDTVLVFDSHARGKDGMPAHGGSGILVTCQGRDGFVRYMRKFYAESEGTAFESLPVYLKVEGY